VKNSTPHLGAAYVVAAGPVKELDVGVVERAAGRDSFVPIALDLSRPQAGEPHLHWHDEKDDQVELGDERISPSTKRPGKHPGLRLGECGPEQSQPNLSRPRLLVGGLSRKPIEIVGIQVAVTVLCGQR